MTPFKIGFDKGTLILQNVPDALQSQLLDICWDERTLTFQPPADRWREMIETSCSHS